MKFYIIFAYLLTAKLLLACEERMTSAPATVNYNKEIVDVSTTDFLRFIEPSRMMKTVFQLKCLPESPYVIA